MLLITETARILKQTIAYSIATRRVLLIVVLTTSLFLAALSLTVVKAVPVALYPFL